jgi:3-oxoacyl-[acyl-carrier-protein] synthase-1/3-oxoacyl-[acyl-carrier-protein] synthase II
MSPIAIVASGALSALGQGPRATSVGGVGEGAPSTVVEDPELAHAGMKRPRSARVSVPLPEAADRACALLEAAALELVARLDADFRGWRELRVAVVVGTSAGGMPSLERALAARARRAELDRQLARAAFYDAPLLALAPLFGASVRWVNVLGACVASTFAIGLGCRWLEAGDVDLVIAGGYDALSAFVATGFEALGATTANLPLPFRAGRDGMALGEGAALLALMRAGDAPRERTPLGFVLGFGATSDAVHVTAPDPTGRGLARAAQASLDDAGLAAEDIELVSAHATATPHNDAAESAALRRVFGERASSVLVHSFKGSIGHTFGAAGALEVLAALDALQKGVLPASVGSGALEPTFPCRLLGVSEAGRAKHCLKLSAAFGGSNAALVLSATDDAAVNARPRARRRIARLVEGPFVAEPDLGLIAQTTRLDEVRRARLDRASALAVTAVARALDALPPFERETTGVVVGTCAASLEADETFDARRRERIPAGVEPRRFPATSPNLPAAACSIAFDFRGPSLAVGGGPTTYAEAFAVGESLVANGDAERVIVVLCNDTGEVTRALCRAADFDVPRDGATAVVLGAVG